MTLTDINGFDPLTGEITDSQYLSSNYNDDLPPPPPPAEDIFDDATEPEICIEQIMRALNSLAQCKALNFVAGTMSKQMVKDAKYWHDRTSEKFREYGKQIVILDAGMGGEITIAKRNNMEDRQKEAEEQMAFFQKLIIRATDTYENVTGNYLPATPAYVIKPSGKATLMIQLRRVEQAIIAGDTVGTEIPDVVYDQARNLRLANGFDPDKPHVFKADDTSDVITNT